MNIKAKLAKPTTWAHTLRQQVREVIPNAEVYTDSYVSRNGLDYDVRITDGCCIDAARFCLRRVNRVVAFSCKLWIAEQYRGKGLYKTLHTAKVAAAKEQGYKMLFATVDATNEIELEAAQKHGWKFIDCCEGSRCAKVAIIYLVLKKGTEYV